MTVSKISPFLYSGLELLVKKQSVAHVVQGVVAKTTVRPYCVAFRKTLYYLFSARRNSCLLIPKAKRRSNHVTTP